jgi:hypothetical protein
VKPPIERPRVHKGFVLGRGKEGLITIRDANGNPLSETMKFIDFDIRQLVLRSLGGCVEGRR